MITIWLNVTHSKIAYSPDRMDREQHFDMGRFSIAPDDDDDDDDNVRVCVLNNQSGIR